MPSQTQIAMSPGIGAESSMGIQDYSGKKAPSDGIDTVVCEGDQVSPTRAIDTILTTVQKRHEMEIIRGYNGMVFAGTKKKARSWLSGLVDGCGSQIVIVV